MGCAGSGTRGSGRGDKKAPGLAGADREAVAYAGRGGAGDEKGHPGSHCGPGAALVVQRIRDVRGKQLCPGGHQHGGGRGPAAWGRPLRAPPVTADWRR